ncbi:MAG: DUF927 domain-containing protein, partial [Roseiarcus sp.]
MENTEHPFAEQVENAETGNVVSFEAGVLAQASKDVVKQAEYKRLAELPADEYRVARAAAAEMLGVSPPTLDAITRKLGKALAGDRFTKFAGGHKSGFAMKVDGLHHFDARAERWRRVAGAFEIEGRSRDTSGRGWGLSITWRDDDFVLHRERLGQAELQGDPGLVCARLAHGGLWIRKSGQHALAEYLEDACRDCERRIRIVAKTGWHRIGDRKVFVLPDGVFGVADGMEEVVFDGDEVDALYTSHGSLEGWRDGVARLAHGHIIPTFTLSHAFAGPLLGLLAIESGGFDLVGFSSIGKTTLQMSAASVWGEGRLGGFARTWCSTANALEGEAEATSDTVFVLDEMKGADPIVVNKVIYTVCGNVGRGRANRDGSLRDRKSWRSNVLSSSEKGVALFLEAAGLTPFAGQAVRLVGVLADRGLGQGVFDHTGGFADASKLADAVGAAAIANYGVAGPEYLRRLTQLEPEALPNLWRAFEADFIKEGGAESGGGQVLRVAKRFALAALAGELATFFGITGWRTNERLHGDARAAALWVFKAWLEKRGGLGSREDQIALDQIRRLLARYGDARFERTDSPTGQAIHDR